jgi:HK97 family phage major capsid protein/HK97 family phage prohead protease
MADRAYSTFVLTKADAEQRVIEGLASTPELDRQGDSMDPAGAKFALPLPLLWQHRADQPIGHVTHADVTPTGIVIRAQIAKGLAFIDDAWALMKAGLVGGLSIDWRPLAAPTLMKGGGYRYGSWNWLALSAVTIPANASASIRLIKSLDRSSGSAASGQRSGEPVHRPGVTGSHKATPMNVNEQLATEQAALHAKNVRFEELITEEQAHGALEAEQATERDTLETEISTITKKVTRLKALEAAQAATATALFPAAAARPASVSRPRIEVAEHPKGTRFTRYAMAVAAGKGSHSDTVAYAKRFTDTPEVLAYIKAIEGTAVVGSPAWGGELVNANNLATEFVELLRPATIIGNISGFRMVPFNIPIVTQIGGSTFNWVGEAKAKPVGELAFERTTLTWSKAAGIVVLSDELIRLSSPSAEATVRQDLVAQCAQFLDEQFIHVGVTATADHPASITHGANAHAASGTDYLALQADLAAALATFDSALISTRGLAIVTTPAVARGISMLLGPMGQVAFTGVTPEGGSLLGYQLVVSDSVEPGIIAIFKPGEILLADDGRVTLDASNQATLDMSGGNSPTFNLWQKNCVGIRAERWIRWQARREDVVTLITGAAYGPAVGSP